MMDEAQYEIFKRLEDEKQRHQRQEAQAVADKAYNQGLWDAVKWRTPLAYFVLKRR
jgi:hypothetical protein